MGKMRALAAASIIPLMLAGTSAMAGTFKPVAAPAGSVSAGVIGINDQGDVTGSFTSDGVTESVFAGSIDGTYETFDVDGVSAQGRSINNQGRIVGITFPEGSLNSFDRPKNGAPALVTKDGTPVIGIAQGVSASGDFVGDYFGEPGSVPLRGGYKGKNAAYQSDVTLPFPTVRVAPRAINAKGDVAGWFVAEAGGATQGFVIQNGVTTVLNYPDAAVTFIQGMNNKGELSGSWEDAGGGSHGFHLASDLETWTSFDAPEGDFTQAWQINNLGQIAVTGVGATTNSMFIYCPKKAGVCNGKGEKTGAEKAAKGKKASAPDLTRHGRDPDEKPGRGHRQ
ncbi:MAG: hypothetical protein AB7F91_14750 [Parvularculaceae bacterium]